MNQQNKSRKIDFRMARLEKAIGYKFKSKPLLKTALTHASYGDGRGPKSNNERLEFLGDRVLGLLTAERLYDLTTGSEGGMARRLNALVRKEACAHVAREIGLGEALLLAPSEAKQGGRNKTSILGDGCEALLAAIYLDGGYEAVSRFYDEFWSSQLKQVTQKGNKDPKTELQERASSRKYGVPVYTVINRSGPDHRPLFVIEVDVSGLGTAHGTGKSKKDAERFAAIHLLEDYKDKL